MMKHIAKQIQLGLVLVVIFSTAASGQRPGAGPSKVAVGPVSEGILAPQTDYVGTVYFREVADVASEVRGKVKAVFIEDGQHVKQGQPLVHLDDTLLQKDVKAAKAVLKRFQTDEEEARRRMERAENLIEEGITTTEQYESARYQTQSLRYQVESSKANLERLETLIEKFQINAPFDGVVIERQTDLGEWKNEGASVAVIARANEYDVRVNVPEMVLDWVMLGAAVELFQNDFRLDGKIVAIIPRGDVATRTFPVKIRVETEAPLREGLSVSVQLPSGETQTCLMVHRDALVRQGIQTSIFVVRDNTAQKIQVKVLGYQGSQAGILADTLHAGEQVVTKGNERLRPGSEVVILDIPTRIIKPVDTDD